MTALNGYKLQTERLAASSGESAGLSGFAPPMVTAFAMSAAAIAGPIPDRFCIEVLPKSGLSGLFSPQHWQQMEGKILVVPPSMDGLAVISETTVQVEVWNVSGTAQDCLSATVTGPAGVRVGDSIPLPAHFPDTKSAVFPIIVSPDGAPVATDIVTWDCPDYDGDVTFTLSNAMRLVVFSAPMDWSDGPTETIEYLTDVLSAYDMSEQRVQLRDTPTRGLEFTWLAMSEADAAAVAAQLDDWQARVYGMPLWTDAGATTAAAVAGDLAIALDTTDLRFEDGGMALLWAGPREWEAVQIDTAGASELVLWSPLLADWPAQSVIVPLRYARLGDAVDVETLTSSVATGQVSFLWRGSDGNV